MIDSVTQVVSEREQFCAVLFTGPLIKSDAVVLLTGDGESRVPAAVELFRQGAAPRIIVTGGLLKPPHSVLASSLGLKVMGFGVAPDRIVVDDSSMHTQASAAFVIAEATANDWRRLLLVTSPYHMPRAFLTFLRSLQVAGQTESIRLVSAAASHVKWWAPPTGLEISRFDLIADEAEKIDRYVEHVATYAEGIAYLKFWEGK